MIHTRASSQPNLYRPPLRSSMTSRTLHESLHRGRRSSDGAPNPRIKRNVSFAQVNIREYERIMGDNPSVTCGPPLSLGWRYVPEATTISIDDYEEGKGSPRQSSEFLVPKVVRERLLKEHADVSRREMVAAVRSIQKEKSKRQQTVVNLPMQKTEERVEGAKRKMKKILKPSTSYDKLEEELWDNAHRIAIDKAKRLEDSLRRGESVSSRDLYKVGTPCESILPSRRNSVRPVEVPQQNQQQQGLENNNNQSSDGGSTSTTANAPSVISSVEDHDINLDTIHNSYNPQRTNQSSNSRRSADEGEEKVEETPFPPRTIQSPQINEDDEVTTPIMTSRGSNNRLSTIVATEDSEDEDVLSSLLQNDSEHYSGTVSS